MAPNTTPERINLLRGWPSPALLPPNLLLRAAQQALTDPEISTPGLEYGPDEGYLPLREALAKYLTTFFNPSAGPISASRLTITGGASQNLAVLLSAFSDPSFTRKVFVSEPAYYLSFPIFEDAGFSGAQGTMVGVREDEEGVDLVALEKELEESERRHKEEIDKAGWKDVPRFKSGHKKIYKYFIYCVPAFSNPSGRTMSLERRQGLVRLARKFDALIVCDDVYDFLQWRVGVDDDSVDGSRKGGTPLERALLPRIVDVDRKLDGGAERKGADGFGNVASNGSFSKILGPGLRSGWCEGSAKFAYGVSQAGATRSGGAPSQLTSTYITPLVSSGALHTHIQETLNTAYAKRYTSLRAAIAEYLEPLGFTLLSPTTSAPDGGNNNGDDGVGDQVAGGFFAWLNVPPELLGRRSGEGGAKELAARCALVENVVISEGSNFEVPRPHPASSVDGAGVIGSDQSKKQGKFERNFRLCFAWEDEEKLVEGVRRIAKVAERMLKEVSGSAKQSSEGQKKDEEGYVMIDRHGESVTERFLAGSPT